MAGVVEAVLNGCNFVSISADDSYLVIHAKKDLLYQGSHSDWKTWKTWKNGKAFSSQGKVREF